jgi:hypothetical protein
MATLLEAIKIDSKLSSRKRADICSAVRVLCRILGLPLESTPAVPRLFAERLKTLTPAAARMRKGRLQNCKSLLDAAFAYNDTRFRRRRSREALDPVLDELLLYLPDRWKRAKLRRFMHFVSERKIEPDDVDGAVFDAFRTSLEQSLVDNVPKCDREVRKLWNALAERAPEFDLQTVLIPSYVDHYALPEDDFPALLWQEVDAYLSSRVAKPGGSSLDDILTEAELFGDDDSDWDENGRRHRAAPLRASTVALVRYRIRQFASALVRSGHFRPSDITGLAVLVVPETVVTGLNFLIQRAKGKKRTSQVHGIASDLSMIARLYVRSPRSDLRKLSTIIAAVRPDEQGLPESVRRSLAPFRDIENVRAFLNLPELIMADVMRAKTITPTLANMVATALWISITQRAPLRISNLLSTDLTANILRSHHGKNAEVALYYPAHQVKNGKVLEIPLPPRTAKLLDLYLSKYRPVLIKTPSNWLFPAPGGRPKRSSVMSADMQKLMRRHLGFAINPHSYRHVAAKLYLTAHPGRYTDVQMLLGHNRVQTTIDYYCEIEAEAAFGHFDTVLLGLEKVGTIREADQ